MKNNEKQCFIANSEDFYIGRLIATENIVSEDIGTKKGYRTC